MATITNSFYIFIRRLEAVSKQLVFGLASCVVVLMALYGYFVVSTILQVVEREEIFLAVAHDSARISALEALYVESSNLVTLEFAETLGFYEVADIHYVTKTGLALSP